jgi:predicted RNA-binding Zn ribbon-like protein
MLSTATAKKKALNREYYVIASRDAWRASAAQRRERRAAKQSPRFDHEIASSAYGLLAMTLNGHSP